MCQALEVAEDGAGVGRGRMTHKLRGPNKEVRFLTSRVRAQMDR